MQQGGVIIGVFRNSIFADSLIFRTFSLPLDMIYCSSWGEEKAKKIQGGRMYLHMKCLKAAEEESFLRDGYVCDMQFAYT